MRSIVTIAGNTFRETVRDKILYNLIFIALGLILFSIVVGQWAVFATEIVIKDFTLGVISFSGLLISIFVGIGLVHKEIQKRTVLTLLAKPVSRWQFILGKYTGLLGVVLIHLSVMTLVFYLVLWITQSSPSWALLQAIYLLFFEMALVVAVALMFSTFTSTSFSAFFALAFYVAGHLTYDIVKQVEMVTKHGGGESPLASVLHALAKTLYYIVPNLENFNIKGQVVHHEPVSATYLLFTSLYGISFIGLFVFVACWWFGRRDFI